jgi:hypothetical protein
VQDTDENGRASNNRNDRKKLATEQQ